MYMTKSIVMTNTTHWDPEAIEHLQERLLVLDSRMGRPPRPMRVALHHNPHHAPEQQFSVSVHIDGMGHSLHAHGFGENEYGAASEVEDRLRALLEHESKRRWWTRHHARDRMNAR
jgi:ribosome-associated translation inhibitor RaiA